LTLRPGAGIIDAGLTEDGKTMVACSRIEFS